MKRFCALMLAFGLFASSALADVTITEETSANGIKVQRYHDVQQQNGLDVVVDYPVFECDDASLEVFLNENVTQGIIALYRLDEADVSIRGGFCASLDVAGLLSVEASVRHQADGQPEELTLYSAMVDLNGKRLLTIDELFDEPFSDVRDALCAAVYERAADMGVLYDDIAGSGDVPLPDSYYLTADGMRVLYGDEKLCDSAVEMKFAWDELPITLAELPEATEAPIFHDPSSVGIIGGADGSTAIYVAEATPMPIVTPEATPTLMPTITPGPVQTLNPSFSLAPVITPTPMPVAGSDTIIVDVLTHGLWKKLGTEGDTYYQFTADGKLLTIQVSDYVVQDGKIESDVFNGMVDIGSDSAFTLDEDGRRSGYVLNRQGESVAPEEFVTPTPTPVPTPTPSPTPEPTPTPVPTPSPTLTLSPTPTPTLRPQQQALMLAPQMLVQPDARFEKRRSLDVYSAPGENTWHAEGAMVTTDENVDIFGVENGWVLVSYAIGNGSRGRIGYIDDMMLSDAENVQPLRFCSLPMTLLEKAEGTDDPLRSQNVITTLSAGEEVTLLAFMDDWAYVQTGLEGRVCRMFIPRKAIMGDE